MDMETDMLRQAVFDSLGVQGLQALALVQGGQEFLGLPPPSVPLSLAPGVPSFSGAPPPSVSLGLPPPASVPLGVAPSTPLVTTPPASLPLVTAPPASVPPASTLGVTMAASGSATPRMSVGVSGLPGGLQAGLMKVIVEQQRQLQQVGVRPAAQPGHSFQVFQQQQVPQVEGLQMPSNPSLRLGAQLAQLSITPGQSAGFKPACLGDRLPDPEDFFG